MACVRTGETAAGCWAGLDPWPEGHTLDVLFIPGAMEGEQPGQGWVPQRPLWAGAGGPEGAGDSWAAGDPKAVRSRALESIFGLGLPAAELVLRPGVLQLQLPLLSLCKGEGEEESHTKALRNELLLPLCASQFKVFLPSKQL